MKINLGTIEVDDFDRRALNWMANLPGLASRKDVRDYVLMYGMDSLTNHVADFRMYLATPPEQLTIRERRKLKNDQRKFGSPLPPEEVER